MTLFQTLKIDLYLWNFLDYQAFLNKLFVEQELLSEITENFIQELPKNIDKIDEALQGKDLKYLEQILNTFKGTISKIFGLLW